MSKVLEFINKFKKSNPAAIEESFTQGNCYWFAFILKKRFPGGDLMYHPINGHFAYRIGDHIYDITGAINAEGYKKWSAYKKVEHVYAKVIKRACIRLRG